jgi:hypothetical protein
MKIIVKGFPRSGSHRPVAYLQQHWSIPWFNAADVEDWNSLPSSFIIHDHNIEMIPPQIDHHWHLIMVYRQNIFDQICSVLWAQHTEEYTYYDHSAARDPISPDVETLLQRLPSSQQLIEIMQCYANCPVRWRSSTMVSYEHMQISMQSLDHLLPAGSTQSASPGPPASHASGIDYSQVISNYHDLRAQFELRAQAHLRAIGVTVDILKDLINNSNTVKDH